MSMRSDELMREIAEIEANIEALEHVTMGETAETIAPCLRRALDDNRNRLLECKRKLRTA